MQSDYIEWKNEWIAECISLINNKVWDLVSTKNKSAVKSKLVHVHAVSLKTLNT